MNATWRAIRDKLDNDATLLALLGSQTASSILGEFEATATTVAPYLTLCYDGSKRIGPHLQVQTWTTYCFHKQTAHHASLILKKVKDALHQQVLSIDDASGVACMECEWFMDVPSDYDPLFKLDIEGSRFLVYARDI